MFEGQHIIIYIEYIEGDEVMRCRFARVFTNSFHLISSQSHALHPITSYNTIIMRLITYDNYVLNMASNTQYAQLISADPIL